MFSAAYRLAPREAARLPRPLSGPGVQLYVVGFVLTKEILGIHRSEHTVVILHSVYSLCFCAHSVIDCVMDPFNFLPGEFETQT
jgi:hypothetical protein